MTTWYDAELLAAGAAGMLFTLILIRTMCRVAPRIGLIDRPDHRKRHAGEVPLVGGIAVGIAYLAIAFLVLPKTDVFTGFALGAALLLLVGALDDVYDLSPRVRLLAQAVAALLPVAAGGLQLTSLGNLAGSGEVLLADWVGLGFTVFCVMSLINGVNMLDGLDGLAGSVCSVALASLLLAAALAGAEGAVAHLTLLVACLAGFLLFHNLQSPWRRRLVFLGDAGSMLLGYSVAWAAIAMAENASAAIYPITAVWILGVVVLDTIATVLRRLRQRRSPLAPGRDHLHHLLLDAGLAPHKVVLVMAAGAVAMAGVGIGGWLLGVPEAWLTWSFVAVSLCYYAAVNAGWRRVARRARIVPILSLANATTANADGAAGQIELQRRTG